MVHIDRLKLTTSKHFDILNQNERMWQKKKTLRLIYREFYKLLAHYIVRFPNCDIVELGSGSGNIKDVIADCTRTDIFRASGIDRIENAYELTFPDSSVSSLIMFDVFHHLKYPGTALAESSRVLKKKGRLIIFEPCLSILGLIVYGLLHTEPMGLFKKIQWFAESPVSIDDSEYYAAQGNASRVFLRKNYASRLREWRVLATRHVASISYVATGGYSKPQLYPPSAYAAMRLIDRLCNPLPALFGTRLLIVLEKR